jgi:hypothetical protein
MKIPEIKKNLIIIYNESKKYLNFYIEEKNNEKKKKIEEKYIQYLLNLLKIVFFKDYLKKLNELNNTKLLNQTLDEIVTNIYNIYYNKDEKYIQHLSDNILNNKYSINEKKNIKEKIKIFDKDNKEININININIKKKSNEEINIIIIIKEKSEEIKKNMIKINEFTTIITNTYVPNSDEDRLVFTGNYNVKEINFFDDKYEFILLIEYLLNKIIEEFEKNIIKLKNIYKSISIMYKIINNITDYNYDNETEKNINSLKIYINDLWDINNNIDIIYFFKAIDNIIKNIISILERIKK